MAGSNARGSRGGRKQGSPSRAAASRGAKRQGGQGRLGTWAWAAGGIVVTVIAVVVAIAVASSPSTPGTASQGTVVQGNGGTWTNITPDLLATKMKTKDFTLLNVKTPYIGEISGTDLYIPYTDLTAKAAELPQDKTAPIVVYCRSGNESAIASQTLLDLGYTNIENLDGGMNAWVASGRTLIQLART
jgi:rhodanese-related sulfurtransferase